MTLNTLKVGAFEAIGVHSKRGLSLSLSLSLSLGSSIRKSGNSGFELAPYINLITLLISRM